MKFFLTVLLQLILFTMQGMGDFLGEITQIMNQTKHVVRSFRYVSCSNYISVEVLIPARMLATSVMKSGMCKWSGG